MLRWLGDLESKVAGQRSTQLNVSCFIGRRRVIFHWAQEGFFEQFLRFALNDQRYQPVDPE